MNKDNNSLRSSRRPPQGTIVRYGWTEAQIKEQEAANAKSKQRREAEKLAVLARRKTTTSINKVMSTSSKTDERVEGAGASTGAVNKAPKESLVMQDPNATKEPMVVGEFEKLTFSSVSSEGVEGDQNGHPNAKDIAGNKFLADKTNLEELLKELEDHLELGSTPEAVNGVFDNLPLGPSS
jgi:hypothetical protein